MNPDDVQTVTLVPGVTREQVTRTTTAIRNTARRLKAPSADLQTALACLFDEARS